MLNAQIKNKFITQQVSKNSTNITESIKKEIKKSKSANMTFDISMLNIIDATKVASIASTYHFLKFEEGKIDWLVSSKEVEKMLKPLNLGNSNFIFTWELF